MNLKIHSKIYTITLCLGLVSCTSFSHKKDLSLDAVVSMVKIDNEIVTNNNKKGLNTSNKNCLRDLAYLKSIDSKHYIGLYQNYNNLAAHSNFYDESTEVMSKEMKEVYAAKLAIKKDKLCILINNTVANEIKSKIG